MSFSFNITGFDKLQRDLEDAQHAFQSLDGTIASLSFDSGSQASIDSAIRQMEDAIDVKTSLYRGNAMVEQVAQGLKEQYRAAILKRAAEARGE